MTVAGLVAGLALAAASTRLLGSLLYGVTPLDPLTFAAVASLLTAASSGRPTFQPTARRESVPQARCGAPTSRRGFSHPCDGTRISRIFHGGRGFRGFL